ncbi:MAG: GMC family oxidoreductase [Candidatus Polarisedimenticolaceae bacterium]|nr:GMC family oxidoreductase [Candidatus Polarisedimenticolaceae bacterium]
MENQYDVIVIGSGFGGAASACRLSEAGKKVLVLERGRRWLPEDYPREIGDAWTWDVDEPENQNGWIDVRFFGDMTVAQCAGVGGGSLIYASVSIEAKPKVFEHGWPVEITYDELKPYYDIVGKMLNVQTIPDNQLPERFRVMRDAAERLGYADRHEKVDLAVTFNAEWSYDQNDPFNDNKSVKWVNDQGQEQGTCVHCANCDIGCQVKAKNTLDLNYLAVAESHGAEIKPLHVVSHIEPTSAGYRVFYDQLVDGEKTPGSFTAQKVILAAGSLGSTELLLRSRDEHQTLPHISRRLGLGWSANGDFVTPAIHQDGRDVSPTQGPTISSSIDLLDGKFEGRRLFVEDGGIPDVLGNYLEEKLKNPLFKFFATRKYPLIQAFAKNIRNRDPFKPVMVWFGQAQDVPDGRMYLGRYWYAPWKRCLKMDWDYRRSEGVYAAMASLHRKLSEVTNAIPLVPPTWTLFKNIITPHPLGGCNMGTNENDGVVDHKCEVFHYPGLYVMDGSVIPRALGLNPSRTITAISERATQIIIAQSAKTAEQTDKKASEIEAASKAELA